MLVSPSSVKVPQSKPGPDGKIALVSPPVGSLKIGAEALIVPPIPEGKRGQPYPYPYPYPSPPCPFPIHVRWW